MLHVLLFLLKLIGIIIVAILLLLLFLLTIALFVPIRYRVYAKRETDIEGKVNASWFLHLFHFSYIFQNSQVSRKIKIFGISFEKWKSFFNGWKRVFKRKKKSKKVNKKNKNEKKSRKNQVLSLDSKVESNDEAKVKEYEENSNLDVTPKTGEEQRKKGDKKENNNENKLKRKLREIIQKIKNIYYKLKKLIKKIIFNLKNVKDKIEQVKVFIQDEINRQTFIFFRDQIFVLIKHIKPKKYRVYLTFGTGDPAVTGQILGVLGMLMPLYKDNATIIPDFENVVLKGEIFIKGRVTLAKVLLVGWKLYGNENIKKWLQHIT